MLVAAHCERGHVVARASIGLAHFFNFKNVPTNGGFLNAHEARWRVIVKKISKVLFVALIGLGSVAAVPGVLAGNPETCWGRCDSEVAYDEALQRWWSVAGADDIAPARDEALQRWWSVAGKDDAEAMQIPVLPTWWNDRNRADDEDEVETMASYR